MASKTETKALNNDEMLTAILSYIGILVLIPLFTIEAKKRNDFIKFHLQQGVNILIVEIIIWVALMILGILTLGFIWILAQLIWAAIVILCVIAIIKAIQKEKWEVPVVGTFKLIKL